MYGRGGDMSFINDLQGAASNAGRLVVGATDEIANAFSGMWPGAAATLTKKVNDTKKAAETEAKAKVENAKQQTRDAANKAVNNALNKVLGQ